MNCGPAAASCWIVSCSAVSRASERGGYSSNENGTRPFASLHGAADNALESVGMSSSGR